MKNKIFIIVIIFFILFVFVLQSTEYDFPPPTISLFPDENDNLVSVIHDTLALTFYLYDDFNYFDWEYNIPDTNYKISNSSFYKLILASTDTTIVSISLLLKKDSDEFEIFSDLFILESEYYNCFSGCVTNNTYNLGRDDVLVFRITGMGSDFGIYLGPEDSQIKCLTSDVNIDMNVLKERSNALKWITNNNVLGYDYTGILGEFLIDLDSLIFNRRSGEWRIGWYVIESEMPYVLKWRNSKFKYKLISFIEALELGVESDSFIFIR